MWQQDCVTDELQCWNSLKDNLKLNHVCVFVWCRPVSVHEFEALWAHRVVRGQDPSVDSRTRLIKTRWALKRNIEALLRLFILLLHKHTCSEIKIRENYIKKAFQRHSWLKNTAVLVWTGRSLTPERIIYKFRRWNVQSWKSLDSKQWCLCFRQKNIIFEEPAN